MGYDLATNDRAQALAAGDTSVWATAGLHPHEVAKAPEDALERLLALATEFGLPLVVHSRDAMDETLDRIERAAPPRRGVMHCWSGNAAQALRAAQMGMKIGFGGSLTYGDAGVEESARRIPDDALLLETDAPYLVPEPKDTKRNEPALMTRVRAKLAALRGTSEDAIDELTTQNAARLLALGIS